ncbi:NADAR family protein [Candidatus Lokiarchaeum ossiferum]|uniref:NADAR family protein n=1 Tax=Candidatus Lokiarchaeum ossiferum TaxID=2951803 RepID=UPI00352C0009
MSIESYLPNNEDKRHTIFFYRASGKYGFLSNLYKAEIFFDGRNFPTSEHAYQFGKFLEPETAEWVMKAPKPHLVAIVSHGLFAWDIVPKWNLLKVKRMEEVIQAKFLQHPKLAKKLFQTGNAELIEKSKMDNFWGNGKKGNGKNMLGKLLMKIREEIKLRGI